MCIHIVHIRKRIPYSEQQGLAVALKLKASEAHILQSTEYLGNEKGLNQNLHYEQK